MEGQGAAEVHGRVAAGFEPVREAFRATFTEHVQVGAALAVRRGDAWLVDLWGGHADAARLGPWREDTLVNLYSCTKGITAIAIAQQVGAGRLDLDAPVARYWPELAQGDKGAVTVAQLLAHEAGLAGLREPLAVTDLYDWNGMCARLAAAEPLWEPGTAVGYHAITWGWLAGELLRRVAGRRPGALLRDDVALPVAADFHVGLPDPGHGRVAAMIGPNRAVAPPAMRPGQVESYAPGPWFDLAQRNPVIRPHGDVGSPAWRRAELPAANGHGTAAALARLYADLAAPEPVLVDPGALSAVTEDLGEAPDLVLPRPLRRARGGFLRNARGAFGPSEFAFGHDGAGGSTGFADPDHRIGVGYVMNQMEPPWGGMPRRDRLVAAIYACLDRA